MASVLETLSTVRLVAALICSTLLVMVCVWLGAYVAPDPMGSQSNLMRFCDITNLKEDTIIDYTTCTGKREKMSIKDANDIPPSSLVMWTQYPHANSGLSMSRWFQFMATSMVVELDSDTLHQYHPGAKLSFEATLYYKEINGSWAMMAQSLQEWDLYCQKDSLGFWSCEQINFFELGSVHHPAYLVNLRLPTYKGKNSQIGTLHDIWITEIHQNGGFTKVMLGIRVAFFILTIFLFTFYLHRIYQSETSITLLHKAVGSLGVSLVLLNAPVEVISLYANVPGLLLWSDIRQGSFYAFLILFLIVFMGEHRADGKSNKSWTKYKYPIFFTAFTSGALLIFDLSERGRQLWDPFHSVWSNESSRWWGMFFISSAVFTLVQDILYLLYLTFKAISSLRNQIMNQNDLPAYQRNQCKSALVRVVGVCTATIVVGAMTVALFAIMQLSEAASKWDEVSTVNFNSGSYLGMYGLANVFALNLLLLYSPANKDEPVDDTCEKKKLIPNGPTVFQLISN